MFVGVTLATQPGCVPTAPCLERAVFIKQKRLSVTQQKVVFSLQCLKVKLMQKSRLIVALRRFSDLPCIAQVRADGPNSF